jgi:very-short-patch-repair endonuclease
MKSLDITHPDLAKQWHPIRNGDLKPEHVTAGSHKKVWWLCPETCNQGCIHEWESSIANRAGRDGGCVYCSPSRKKHCIHQSILYTHPEVAKQWHPTENDDLRPENVTAGSNKRVKWLCPNTCPKGCPHTWSTSITNRCSGDKPTNCPWCVKYKHCEHMSILYTHPELAKQWHPTKNLEKKLTDYIEGCDDKVWWACPKTCSLGCPHEWESSIYSRIVKSLGCPKCSKKGSSGISCEHESIVHTHPELAKEFHPTKNENIDIKTLSHGSCKNINWICEKTCKYGCLHEWNTTVANRTGRGDGCPYCSNKITCIHTSIVHTHPDIAKQWHPIKNADLKPEDYTYGSEVNIWWLCEKTCIYGCIHEWPTNINNRTGGNNCPYCSEFKKNHCIHDSIVYTHPELVKEWHPTKNSNLKPEDYTKGSEQNIWWLCDKKCTYGCLHEWKTSINNRTSGHGCGYCMKLRTCEHDTIKYTHPDIYSEWDSENNKGIDINKITRASHYNAHWKCNKNKNHTWQTKVRNRCYSGTGCPWCVNKTETQLYNYLIKIYPSLIKEFRIDSCKNKLHLPFDFCISDIKTIIELDGMHHFKQVSNWAIPEETIKRDIFKMQKAIKEGYKIIRIFQEDVYNSNEKWLEENLLPVLQDSNRNHVFISSIDNLYDDHIALFESGLEIIL